MRQWRLLDIVAAALLGAVILFFLLVFTSLGDSLVATGQQALLGASMGAAEPELRARLMAKVESTGGPLLEYCPAEMLHLMPCKDPRINRQLSREMNFYRERYCPPLEQTPLCLIPNPKAYRVSVSWPDSLHKIWHDNMPYSKIADRKGHQGWMKKEGSYFIFPGGGTMFLDGAVQYIDKLKKYVLIAGGVLRTALDMGCGVASFGGYLLAENIIQLSFAPRDCHKAQIQFALERGIPAFVAMLGDYLVISGPPVQCTKQDKEWADLQAVGRALC